MLPGLMNLDLQGGTAIGCPPGPPGPPGPSGPSGASGPSGSSGGDGDDDEEIDSGSDTEDGKELKVDPVYKDQENLFIHNWGLADAEAIDVLCQFAALYAYQSGDTLSDMVASHFKNNDTWIEHQLKKREDLYWEIKGLPFIVALMMIKKDAFSEEEEKLVPQSLVAQLKSTEEQREKLALVETALLLSINRGRRRSVNAICTALEPPDKTLMEDAVGIVEEADKLWPDRRTFSPDRMSPPVPRLVLNFVLEGLKAATNNAQMLTTLEAETVLYHGSHIPIVEIWQEKRMKTESGSSSSSFTQGPDPDSVVALANGIVSTSTDPKIAYRFKKYSVIGIKLKTPVNAIVYASLNRAVEGVPRLWDKKWEEREVILPPGLRYTLPDGYPYRPMRASGTGIMYYEVEVRQPEPEREPERERERV